ncbi:hypothetical protein [Demequina sp. NBRC 110051]|uniref:hypothetical protein n=1 Tax=Demequina sp. NBRC 110051 TaxID=1570340 RepID=UPI000A06583C|nr:hypothetical protein [Demequina sp. NBRC 110051]
MDTTTVTTPRPKPLIGALLGLLLGIVVSALLWILGVTPPDRLPLFGIVAVAIAVTTYLTTLAPRHATGRFATAMVLAALCGGVALTGIPEYVGTGSLSSGCTAEATSSLEPDPRGPAQTSATDPFDVTQDDTVVWSASTENELTEARPSVALMLGGFRVPLWNGQDAYSGPLDLTGEDSVDAREQIVRDAVGFPLTGTYHFGGDLEGSTGGCEAYAYVRVAHDGAFVGTLAITLWVLLGVVVALIVVAATLTARSLVIARRHGAPTTDRITTTGGTAPATFTSGTMAQQPDQVTGDPEPSRARDARTADAAAGVAAASVSERGRGSASHSGSGRTGSGGSGSGSSRSTSLSASTTSHMGQAEGDPEAMAEYEAEADRGDMDAVEPLDTDEPGDGDELRESDEPADGDASAERDESDEDQGDPAEEQRRD